MKLRNYIYISLLFLVPDIASNNICKAQCITSLERVTQPIPLTKLDSILLGLENGQGSSELTYIYIHLESSDSVKVLLEDSIVFDTFIHILGNKGLDHFKARLVVPKNGNNGVASSITLKFSGECGATFTLTEFDNRLDAILTKNRLRINFSNKIWFHNGI